ncbi:hypothetical protein, conserved [Plasmodium ovale curtisi]|uniref:Uncharacterized protein n=1 Tax=Plasmodium ovale curtisi TaxID=864141 RepID=A0A1A8VVQ9_PLAOA|nr:hypothetical protein, conserved [Plasmodium ovale curtisi]
MEVEINNKKALEKETQFEMNNINRIILDILCAEAIRKIKFILHVLKELLKKKTNILHVYITNDIDHLSTENKRKQIFNSLQDQIELCENENDYNKIKKKIEQYINTLSETNEILCQNSPVDRNIKENRDKIIEDGLLLLNIFRKIKKLHFASVLNELNSFKDEQNLLLNLNQNVYHKKQITNILKEQIKEQIENTKNKKRKIQEQIEQIEKKKKIFFVKSMLYYIYKEEYVHANVSNYHMHINFNIHSTKTTKESMEEELKTYDNVNDYIREFLNKRNDSVSVFGCTACRHTVHVNEFAVSSYWTTLHLQAIHDNLVDYYEKEKRKRHEQLDEIKHQVPPNTHTHVNFPMFDAQHDETFVTVLMPSSIKRITFNFTAKTYCILLLFPFQEKYEQVNKLWEDEEKKKMRKEIDEKEYLKKFNESVLFLQNIGRSKIKDYDTRKKKSLKKRLERKKNKNA